MVDILNKLVLATWRICSKKCLLAVSSNTNKTPYGFTRDSILVCYFSKGLMMFKDTLKDRRPLFGRYTIRNVFRPRSVMCLNDKGCFDL